MAAAAAAGAMTKEEILALPSSPAISPSYPAGPYRFKNREYFIIVYETDPAALRRVVPKPLVPASNLVYYEWIAMPDSSGFGSYEESGTVIPCLFEGKEVNYTAQMFLDCEPPIAAGREIWGFPKKYAQPKLRVESDTLVGVLEYGGQQIAMGSMAYKSTPLVAADCAKALGKTSVNLKIIPGVDFQNSICQLVAYNIQDIEIIECWTGAARLSLKAHANASTAELPIRKIVGSKHIKANLTLPYGQVLYDYVKRPGAALVSNTNEPIGEELSETAVLMVSGMPAICPSYARGTASLKNREYLVIRYETDPACVLPLLPNNVNLPAYGAHAIITWIKTEGSGLGSYSKVVLHVPVIFKGEEYNFSILAVVDSSAPRCFGREVFGQPQKFGFPSLKVNNDTLEASVRHGTQTVVEASMSYKYQRMFPEKAIIALAAKELNLKLIPGVDGKPAVAQLVVVQYNDVSVTEAWSGQARLNLHPHVAAPFADFPIKKLQVPTKLVTVPVESDVKATLQILANAKLLSAVVMDHGSFVDFVHLGEIAAELAIYHKSTDSFYTARVIPEMERQRHPNTSADSLNVEAFFHVTMNDVIKHQHQKFIRAAPTDTLLAVAKQMQAEKVYRVAVCDAGTRMVVDVLTQTDILQWIANHSNQEWFAKHAAIPISSVIGERALVKVPQSHVTVDCFSLLRKHAFSSLPVVLDDGRLYAVISATVLRGLGPADAMDFLKPVGQFLTDRKSAVGGDLVVGTPDMAMLAALQLMGKHRLHRLYIVNKYHVPVAVLSLTDVIAWLIKLEQHSAAKP